MIEIIEKLKKGQNLSFEESKTLFNELMEGKYNENSVIEILEFLIKKGETKDELAGGIFVLRKKATKVRTDESTIDTCGTGGDGKNSLNISTAAAIVLASMGVKVAKHGNKAVSSNCGSADVLEALRININLKPNEAEESIKKLNFAFMFAPNYHSAMKHVGPARKKMKKETIF
jgi:anthranilate phosphoribosyltransferase